MNAARVVLIVAALVAGCVRGPGPEATSGLRACPTPRPQVCTADYQPVCGTKDDDTRATYSNGCNACSDPVVIGYVDGECGGGAR